jgi:Holliday junction resolvase RusA-like endonuclease
MATEVETIKPLTARQAEVLEFVRWYIGKHGFSPTTREIGRAFGFSSPHAAWDHLQALRRKGHIDWIVRQHRSITLLDPAPAPVARPRLLCAFRVLGHPVPWQHHEGYGKYATKPRALKVWQEGIAMIALHAMGAAGIRGPYAGAVRFTADFTVRARGKMGDLTNLQKACEDACQGIVIVNDTQVVGWSSTRRRGDDEGVTIAVETVEEGS